MELNDLRIIICLRKSEVVVRSVFQRILVHDIDFKVMTMDYHSVRELSTPVCNSVIPMVTDLWCHLTLEL